MSSEHAEADVGAAAPALVQEEGSSTGRKLAGCMPTAQRQWDTTSDRFWHTHAQPWCWRACGGQSRDESVAMQPAVLPFSRGAWGLH